MSIRGLFRGASQKGYATPTNAPIRISDSDNRARIVPAGTGSVEVILQEAGGASVYERLITTRVLTAADSGKTFALALAGGFTVTLPDLSTVSGFSCTFIVEVPPTTAYIISTAAADLDKMAGLVFGADGAAGDTETTFTADQLNFVANVSLAGDRADFHQVGTAGWSAHAFVALAATSATFTG